MIQGKEFTDFESDFIEFVKHDIKQGGFHALVNDTGLCADELIEALGITELYDCDYLDMEGELNADELFSNAHMWEKILCELEIVEVWTIRIPCKLDNESILFMAIGESQLPCNPYTCYIYGFITEAEGIEPRYYFHCITEIENET